MEAGYAAMGSFGDNVTVGSASIQPDGKGRSIFGAATGRLPVSESFARHGRLGLSAGKVSGTNVRPASDELMGSKKAARFSADGI